MKREIWFSEIHAIGDCKKCGEPSTGKIDSDEIEFTLQCVSCYKEETFKTENVRLKVKIKQGSEK